MGRYNNFAPSRAALTTEIEGSFIDLIFTGISDPVLVLDADLNVQHCNEAVHTCLDLPIDQIVGQPWTELFPQPEQDSRDKKICSVVSEGLEWNARIPVLDLVHGGSRLYDVKGYPVRQVHRQEDPVTHVVVYMHEVTEEVNTFLTLIDCNRELQLMKDRLEEKTHALTSMNQELTQNFAALQDENSRLNVIAVVDAMTGLPNYRAFNDRVHIEIKQSVLTGRPVSLVLFDIDNFKQYNDQFGHPQGDDLLRQMAIVLRDNIRAADFPARYGGEEFGVLLPRTDKFGAVVVAERLRSKIAEFPMPNRSMTISLGIAEFPSDTQTVEELINQADKAMYVAKSYGKNTTCLWSRDRLGPLSMEGRGIERNLIDAECVPVLGMGKRTDCRPTGTRVLLVDKDDLLLATMRDALQEFGYAVVTATSGRAALCKLAEAAGTFAVLVTELALPDRTGFELAEQAGSLQPNIPVVFTSALPGQEWTRKAAIDERVVLSKPIHIATLLSILGQHANGSPSELSTAA